MHAGITAITELAVKSNGKRFALRADEKLTAFLELERPIHEFAVSLIAENCD
jgi:hypothetical protein